MRHLTRPVLHLIAVPLAFVVSGCSVWSPTAPAAGVTLTTASATYAIGDRVEGTIVNERATSITYNTCNATLQVLDWGVWKSVTDYGPNCGDFGIVLPPGSSRAVVLGSAPLPPSIRAGSWARFHDTFSGDNGSTRSEAMTTQPFRIQQD